MDAGGDGNSIDLVFRNISNAARDALSSGWLPLDDDLGEEGLSYDPCNKALRGKFGMPPTELGDLDAKLNISMSSLSS